MGTAGHIDHGKTTLIKALTGFDCDTHREEKQRGITIHLGFTHLDLPDGTTIGIVDVPGHADFIRTMVAGASGVDFVLLVVAADSGVMPQTHEHLQILSVLGVRHGLIAVTKADLAEPEVMAMAREEIDDAVAGTFLETAPLVEVSATTGAGLDELRQAIAVQAAAAGARPGGEVFRMFVDRIFSVEGFGTVVTGSVLSGTLRRDHTAWLLPGEQELRVRRLERFGQETDQVQAGDRAAINLVGLAHDDFRRGMLIADRPLRSTTMLDARMRLFPHARAVELWSQVHFLLGTYESQARVHLLNRDQAGGGEEVLVQIHLPTPCVSQVGDHFVIRNTSGSLTLGGGEIIDAFPLHHRRRPATLIEQVETIAAGSLPELVVAEVRKARRAVSCRLVADTLNLAEAEVMAAVDGGSHPDQVRFEADGRVYLDTVDGLARAREIILRNVTAFHKRNPLEARGPTLGDLLGATGRLGDQAAAVEFNHVLGQLQEEKRIKPVDNSWAAWDHEVEITPQLARQIKTINDYIRGCGLKTPLMSEMLEKAQRLDLDERELRRILRYLVGRGDACVIDDNFISAKVVDRARRTLLTALVDKPEGVTVADFRDLINGNRKICLLLISRFDEEGITRRDGDYRKITDKGREYLERNV